jgi:hypothetical protein
MAISVSFLGTSYSIPETPEEDWGTTVTNFLVAVAKADNISTLVGALLLLVLKSATTVPTASSTVTPTNNWHKLAPASAVTLDTTTAVAAGTTHGQLLVLSGTSDTNTVTIIDASNVQLKGNVVLGLYDFVVLLWDSAVGDWLEVARNS